VHSLALSFLLALALSCSFLSPAAARAQCVGEDCSVVPPRSSVEAPRTAVTSTDLLWPASPPTFTGVVERPYLQRGRDFGFLAAGVVLLSVGLGVQLLVGGIDQLASNCFTSDFRRVQTCNSWPYAFVPFAGGILAGTVSMNGIRLSNAGGAIGGPLALVPQLVGLAFLMFAVHGYTEDVVPGIRIADVRVQIFPYASASEGGLTLAFEL
jgi:hypothetical protein